MWNFLDNAKLHVEDPSLAGDLGLDGEDWDDGEDGGGLTGFAQAVAKAAIRLQARVRGMQARRRRSSAPAGSP